jgi:3-hydroxyacyl-CoA dehydrogenase/enoyl-CoA hydratase/3-hydroxybutyryl-CoA epimerase
MGLVNWHRRDDGIVVLTLDDPNCSANTITAEYVAEMGAEIDRLEAEKADITGVIVTSGKDTFLVGLDLKEFTAGSGTDNLAQAVAREAAVVKAQFRTLETLGKPVVAALPGTALGGGLELALACHHRIAVDSPSARFGLPEVTLGLLPGGGGVTRVVRMLGVTDALTNVLMQGQRMRASQAKAAGLLDELVASRDELLARATEWILANPHAAQPWDRSGYRMPGGRPGDRSLAMLLPAFPANLRKQLKGTYPAPHAIMCAAVEGAQVDIDTALRIEGRWFASIVGSPVQRNMTQAFFFDLQHLNRGGSRPSGVPAGAKPGRVGIIGAGMMGAGIAYSCARAGIDVVLVDTTREAAERGKSYSQRLLDKAVARGRSTVDRRDAHLARITPTDSFEDLAGCAVVIEAVFEDLALKYEVFAKVLKIVGPDTLLASNTSSLPITSLAAGVDDAARFVGLHFFSPVDKMPLVEIVRGRETGDEAIARGYDLVRAIDKTPIVVNDSRGFFTSRIFGVRVMEGLAMVAEGVPASSVEQAALQAGYPVGPLAVLDEVTLTLGQKLRDEARKAGAEMPAHPGEVVQRRLIGLGRTGKSAGAGFYDYPAGEPKRLWPGLRVEFGRSGVDPSALPMRDLQERLLFVEAIEAAKCVDEGVLTGAPDGNIGSIFGIGFPAWTGGVLRYVEQYPGGVAGFVTRARELAGRYGSRFTPPTSLVEHSKS